MAKIKYPQIQQIFKHLPEGAKDDKEYRGSLVAQFSEEGKTSVSDLTEDEANVMIASLSNTYSHFALFEKGRKQHGFLLALCYQVKDKDGNSKYIKYSEKQKRMIPDLDALGKWIAHRSKFKKPLSALSPQQTGVLIEQFKKVVKFGYEKV